MKRVGTLLLVAAAVLSSMMVSTPSHAGPFVSRTVPINTAGVSDVVFNNGYVFGTQMQSGNMFVIDPAGGSILEKLSIGVSRTHMLASDPGTKRVYVTNYDTSQIQVIDASLNPPAVIGSATVGQHPVAIDIDPTSKRIFVGLCCEESRSVVVLDGSVNPPVVLTTVLVGNGPDHLAVDAATGMVYVGNFDSATVSVIKGRNNPPVESAFLALPQDARTGRVLRPNAIAVNPNTHLVYISCGDSTAEQHQIEVYDSLSGKSVDTFPTGQFIAGDIAVDALNNKVWFSLPLNRFGNFYWIDGDLTKTKARTVAPNGYVVSPNFANFALDPDTLRAFGAGQDSIVVMEDDSIKPVVYLGADASAPTPPAMAVSNINGLSTAIVGGATDDNAGVAAVSLTFDLIPTDTLGDAASSNANTAGVVKKNSITKFAKLSACTARSLQCTWTLIGNAVNAGVYNVTIKSIDIAGNVSDPVKLVMVVV